MANWLSHSVHLFCTLFFRAEEEESNYEKQSFDDDIEEITDNVHNSAEEGEEDDYYSYLNGEDVLKGDQVASK